jgi:GT2 family glycosyltransferase
MNDSSVKFSIAYTIHNKESVVPLIAESLVKVPENVEVLILFDCCDDRSVELFLAGAQGIPNLRVFENAGPDLYEIRANNFLLEQSRAEFCVLFQDDMVPRDFEFLDTLKKLSESQDRVGVVGFKDGFAMDAVNTFTDGYSSPWSDSKFTGHPLNPGECKVVDFVNRGPLAISRNTVKTIGLLGDDFFPLFWDDCDYCIRARKGGWKVFVSHANILTDEGWGTTRVKSKVPLAMCNYVNRVKLQTKWKMDGPPTMIKRLGALSEYLRFRTWRILARMKASISNVKELGPDFSC